MDKLPYRTHATWLDDIDLILLDAMFDRGASFRLLRSVAFRSQWNLGYSHDLTDDQLRIRLQKLVDGGVLMVEHVSTEAIFRMASAGGELWSRERCPVWERFCFERYIQTLDGRELMSVVAVSSQIRDDFLRIWPVYAARRTIRRRVTAIRNIENCRLLNWKSFECYHVGLATYRVQRKWGLDEFDAHCTLYREHIQQLEKERSWWRTVPELQRFVPNCD
ncbi:MAG: hypothetical protein HQ518_19615 [Rhodopirellula sp.]|nr:hypothetical protein [Rhodopirellula sp.]